MPRGAPSDRCRGPAQPRLKAGGWSDSLGLGFRLGFTFQVGNACDCLFNGNFVYKAASHLPFYLIVQLGLFSLF